MIYERVLKSLYGPSDRQTDRQTGRQAGGRTDRQTEQPIKTHQLPLEHIKTACVGATPEGDNAFCLRCFLSFIFFRYKRQHLQPHLVSRL